MRNKQRKASELENNRKAWFDCIDQKSCFSAVEERKKMRIPPNYTGKIYNNTDI